MEVGICESCKRFLATNCCVCSFPIQLYCEDCFHLHISNKVGALHYKQPSAVKSAIDTRDKQRQLVRCLMEMFEYEQNSADACEKFEAGKRAVNDFFDNLHGRIQDFHGKLIQNIDEMSQNARNAVANTSVYIALNLPQANETMERLSTYLSDVFSFLGDVEAFIESSTGDKVMQVLEQAVGFKQTNIDLVLCLPSNQALGVFPFNTQALVKEVQDKVGELKGLPQFDLFFGDRKLRSDEMLGNLGLPSRAVVGIFPIARIRSTEGVSDIYISDTETIGVLRARLTDHDHPITPHHHLVCNDKVLDDDFLIINAGKDSIFDLIVSEHPMEVILIRDETFRVYELPRELIDEEVRTVKHYVEDLIGYDEDSQRLSYNAQELRDEETMRKAGVVPGSVINLERLTKIYVLIPAIRVPFCIILVNSAATVIALKMEITMKLQLPPDHQEVIYRGRPLPDDEMLSSLHRSSINITLNMKEYMLASYRVNEFIAIAYLGGEELVLELKIRLAEMMNLQAHRIQVVYDGRQLNNSDTLSSVNVHEGSLVSVIKQDESDTLRELTGLDTAVQSAEVTCLGTNKSYEADSGTNESPAGLAISNHFLKVTVKYFNHEDMILERQKSTVQIITMKEMIRGHFVVPVSLQELFHGNRRAEDYSTLADYTVQGEEEGLVFRLQVKGE